MANDPISDFGGTFLTFVIVAILLAIALLVSYVALLAIPAYVGYRLYTENPKRLERLAREETMVRGLLKTKLLDRRPADAKNPHACHFLVLERISPR